MRCQGHVLSVKGHSLLTVVIRGRCRHKRWPGPGVCRWVRGLLTESTRGESVSWGAEKLPAVGSQWGSKVKVCGELV